MTPARDGRPAQEAPLSFDRRPTGLTLFTQTAMPIRDFSDSQGVQWRVWDTTPWAGAVYDERLKAGWLTFESAAGRKRLAPIPPDWEDASDDRLDLMCRAAEGLRSRATSTEAPEASADSTESGRRPDTPEHK